MAGWAPGPVWMGAKSLAPTGIRCTYHAVRGELLYRLSYPGPHDWSVRVRIFSSDCPQFQTKAPPMKPRIEVSGEGAGSRSSTAKRQQCKISTSSLDSHLQANDSPTNRRLTPVLTITLPSTEELRTDQQLVRSNSKPPPSPQTEDRHHKITPTSEPATSHQGANGSSDLGVTEDTSRNCDQQKRQVRRLERFTQRWIRCKTSGIWRRDDW